MSIKSLLVRFTALYIVIFSLGYSVAIYFELEDGTSMHIGCYNLIIILSSFWFTGKNKRNFYKDEKKSVVKYFILINMAIQILLFCFLGLVSGKDISSLDFIWDSGFMILLYSVFIYFMCQIFMQTEEKSDDKNILSFEQN